MKRIVVSKTGSVLRHTNVGDARDQLGILEYLRDQGHAVCFLGRAQVLPEGVDYIEWCVQGDWLVNNLKAEVERVCIELSRWKPNAILNCVAQCPTVCDPDNPRGVIVQQSAMRYTAPLLFVYHKTGMPRLCIVNDPRSYPFNAESSWLACGPSAVLTQEHDQFVTRRVWGEVQGLQITYGRCENWWSYGMNPVHTPRPYHMVLMGHAHGREQLWDSLLGDIFCERRGRGWPDGPVDNPYELLRTSSCGPIMPIRDGFHTGKLRQYALHGCAPLLYTSNELTYDKPCDYVAQSSPLRFRDHDELRALSVADLTGFLEPLVAVSSPNFSSLNNLLAQWT